MPRPPHGFRPFLVADSPRDPAAVERLLRSLPEWFGIESAITGYVEAAKRLDIVLAWPLGNRQSPPIGVLLAERHFPTSAGIHVMAVDRAWHRRGVGRALIEHAEARLSGDGVRVLSVKTLGPSHHDERYAATRQFYQALGFLPVEEMHGVWPGSPCLLLVKIVS